MVKRKPVGRDFWTIFVFVLVQFTHLVSVYRPEVCPPVLTWKRMVGCRIFFPCVCWSECIQSAQSLCNSIGISLSRLSDARQRINLSPGTRYVSSGRIWQKEQQRDVDVHRHQHHNQQQQSPPLTPPPPPATSFYCSCCCWSAGGGGEDGWWSLRYLVPGWFSSDVAVHSNVCNRCPPPPPQRQAATTTITTTTTSDNLLLVLVLSCCCCCCCWSCLTWGLLLWKSLVPGTCYPVPGMRRNECVCLLFVWRPLVPGK